MEAQGGRSSLPVLGFIHPALDNLKPNPLAPLLLSAVLGLAAYHFIMPLLGLRANKFPVNGRLVVITGASQGMGLCVAKQLAKKGASIAIIARNQEKLDKALQEIAAEAAEPTSQKFLAVSADMTIAVEAKKAFDTIVEWGGVPDIVWTCAGGARLGLFTEVTPEILDSQMKTNYMTALYTAHAAINLMVASPSPSSAPRRHVVFTSSVVAFYPICGYSPYAPAKAALKSLTDALRQECILYDIDVHCCFPATIFTPGFDEEQKTKPGITKKLEESDGGQTPEDVARICISKLEKGHGLVTTSFIGEGLRSLSWGGSQRNSYIYDTLFGWVLSLVWWIIGWQLDGEVWNWKKKHGPFVGQKK